MFVVRHVDLSQDDDFLTDAERQQVEEQGSADRVLYPLTIRRKNIPLADRSAMHARAHGLAQPLFKEKYPPKSPTAPQCKCDDKSVRCDYLALASN